MTIKQRNTAKNLVENGGNVSKAMREAGYADSTSKNPSKFTRSKGWKELTKEYLPDEYLLKELLYEIKNNVGDRKHYLELAFKLKGKFHPSLLQETYDENKLDVIVVSYGDGKRACKEDCENCNVG